MLVLSRKEEETIVIAGNITISFLRIKGQAIRVGIEAPKEIPIRRGELHPIANEQASMNEPQAA
jgi:carbon storage regulator